jgi:hypothetical protein
MASKSRETLFLILTFASSLRYLMLVARRAPRLAGSEVEVRAL